MALGVRISSCYITNDTCSLRMDGDEWEKGDRIVKPRNRCQPGRQPGRPRAAVDRRQNNMLRQCPSGIAQRLPHHAIAVPTAMQNTVTKTMSVAPPLGNN